MRDDTGQPTEDPGPRLAAWWRDVAERMADLPIYNPTLEVQVTDFRRHGDFHVGVAVTPWFMNVVAVPARARSMPAAGATLVLDLPAGPVEAIVGEAGPVGTVALASLFSPMDMFDDPVATRLVADAALEALFERPAPPEPLLERQLARPTDRRSLLFPRRATEAAS
ncbi:hypothetical protein ABB55_12720 [Prosthecomicrobium hirschii]|uniref:Hydrogenase formation protein HupJ n=1 Tax=Prosthecodimorpha hirschii TaxID=665126 RepID=A0A0P6VLW2_9HYPH|nr:[NiFe]-hydrogenase assembly chaperone HybE [Prosthecomicrobium hirschii]KPL52972.1 hypothetical protein ABB55_12720 [Prosthecomicrobium hirschii]